MNKGFAVGDLFEQGGGFIGRRNAQFLFEGLDACMILPGGPGPPAHAVIALHQSEVGFFVAVIAGQHFLAHLDRRGVSALLLKIFDQPFSQREIGHPVLFPW